MQIESLRGLLGSKIMNRVPNARVRELCGVTKGVDERIDDGVLEWFDHMGRIRKDMISKKEYMGGLNIDEFHSRKAGKNYKS